ncbi:MAG: MBL fold metallo-hydrolase, partial [Clostridium sp.]|nr:MBL fold metallo-hydrolase [Clostridium sp.]
FYSVIQRKKAERSLPLEMVDYFVKNSQLHYYLSAYKNAKVYRNINNTLICLKGFSSTTPAVYSATFDVDSCVGGGFYFNVGGYGLVIDPGINFVENMHKNKIFIEDIDAVIVTHNHLDHNKDIGTISALQHDLNRYYRQCVAFYNKYFDNIDFSDHKISWYLDESTKNDTQSYISDSIALGNCKEWSSLSDNLSFMVFETKHIVDGLSYGVKIKIQFEDRELCIGYTSDTGFFPELIEYLEDVDVMIFNISDVYEKDIRGKKAKRSHLGYDGSIKLLKNEKMSYQVAIASEFCCTNGDYRMAVVKKLREQADLINEGSIVVGEVGLQMFLDEMKIVCSKCGIPHQLNLIEMASPKREFGKIDYICPNCRT